MKTVVIFQPSLDPLALLDPPATAIPDLLAEGKAFLERVRLRHSEAWTNTGSQDAGAKRV